MNAIRLFWDKWHLTIGAVALAVLGAVLGSLLAAGVITTEQATKYGELIGGAIAIATGATRFSARATDTTVKLTAWSLVLAVFICLVQSGCSGYESSPWGPTQKANPGTRIQYGASGLDVGATADSQAKVSGFEVVKPDGTKVKCDSAEFGQKPSDTRLADVKQLEATGAIQAIHWAGINAMTSTIASAIPGLAGLLGRNDVPQDAKNTLQSVLQSLTTAQQQVYQGAQVLQTMGLLPVTTTAKPAEVGPPAPSTQPVK